MTRETVQVRPETGEETSAEDVHVDREESLRLERALGREWLETNGCGGYASSTSLLCPTRRYHGLLVVTPPGHAKRHVFLARVEESLHREGRSFPLSNARYGETMHPTGYSAIESFDLVPHPKWTYRIGEVEVVREVLLSRGAPTVLVRYRMEGPRTDAELRLRPLLAFREADALTFENLALDRKVRRADGGVWVAPYPALPPMHLTVGAAGGSFEADPVWYRGVEYAADLQRGYDGHEDHFSPGWFSVPLGPGEDVVLAATIGDPVGDPNALWTAAAAPRRQALAAAAPGLEGRLHLAADDFLDRRPDGRTGVVAGYPWFGEWGRDTCIALPGLLLARGRVEEAGDALEGLVPHLQDGLLPNVFAPTAEASHYGSVDASLFFARAVRLYQRAGGRRERVLEAFAPALSSIASHYRDGTRLGIVCDDGGLIRCGGDGLNPTWMDAIADGVPVTPRDGCPVEVNALWYALLAQVEQLDLESGDRRSSKEWGRLRRLARSSFLERFWLPEEEYLADVWRDGEADRSIRPNAVIAAALETSPLSRGKRTDVVRRARAELLTPFGLRTLGPEDAAYRGRYAGGPAERDSAYHQGTVWPWLLGFFAEAYLRAFGSRRKRVDFVRSLLDGFATQLHEAGLGQISEVHDGDPPHEPGGAIAQAWSVAELVRAYRMLEDGRP